MEFFELNATERKTVGNGPARRLRREKMMPAVLYGPHKEPLLLSVNIAELEMAIRKSRGGQVFLQLVIQNGEGAKRYAMIKELQTHPVSSAFLHVDFYEIAMDRRIKVKVPVVTSGTCIGVEQGGMLQVVRRELELDCLPDQIPTAIEVDVTGLGIGDSIHVSEIQMSEGIDIQDDANFAVVTVLSPKVEAEPGEEAEGAEGEEEAEGAAEAEAGEEES